MRFKRWLTTESGHDIDAVHGCCESGKRYNEAIFQLCVDGDLVTLDLSFATEEQHAASLATLKVLKRSVDELRDAVKNAELKG